MRLGLIIQDQEYRKALIRSISECDNEILLDVIGKGDAIESDALIITDAKPADLDENLLEIIKKRTVFIDSEKPIRSNHHSFQNVFKYSGVSRLLADISDYYCLWKGINNHSAITSKVIACCSDSDAFSFQRCSQLARQIIYRHGGSVLILPLGYINEYALDYGRDINSFARMIYLVRKERLTNNMSIAYTDSYGISHLMLPPGRNPIAYLDGDDLSKLISAMSGIFDTVILDIAGCYRHENLEAIKNAGNLICLETGRKRFAFDSLLKEEDRDRMMIIKMDGESGEDLALDEYVRKIYGIKDVS